MLLLWVLDSGPVAVERAGRLSRTEEVLVGNRFVW